MDIRQTALSALQGLNMDSAEMAVYIALLELGSQPASVIAKKAKLKRGHTYNVLSLLRDKGVVQEFEKGSVKYFTGCSPTTLVSLVERREEELGSRKKSLLEILPELERLRNPMAVQPKVRFFSGIDGIKEIYEDTLRIKNQPIYAVGDFDHYFPRENSPALNDWIWRYCTRRADRNIWYMGIVNKSPTTDLAFKKRKTEKRKLKMLRNIDLSVEVNIYGDKVALISSSKDMVGLIVEDKPTADTLRNFHQAVWKLLPEYSM